MDNGSQQRGKKRSKAFYRKSTYGSKKHCQGTNILEPGIRGFLVMCNHEERCAVRESYNILNEYADDLYGPDKNAGLLVGQDTEDKDDSDDMETAMRKEVEELKRASSSPMKRFQNVSTKAKNCVFIRTSLENPVEVTSRIMEDIAEKHLKKARYAARILPILGTCRANTKDIEKLALDILQPMFSKQNGITYTVLFKMRNNNGTSCGRESVIPAIINLVKDINPDMRLSWTDYSTAIVIEIVCTVCCFAVAPDYFRLRKYNLQELQQGLKEFVPSSSVEPSEGNVAIEKNSDGAVKSSDDESKRDDAQGDGVNTNINESENGKGSDTMKTDQHDDVEVEEKSVIKKEEATVVDTDSRNDSESKINVNEVCESGKT